MPPPSNQSEATLNDPTPRKRRRKRDDPQSCFTNAEEYESDDCSPMSCSDVESFQGKIVYNPDGSAYIIDSENESLSNISENCMSVGATTTNNPKIHSFRVVTARDASVNISEPNKIQKPILMCFICKLSFGNTKSFSLHANSEHTLNLQEPEKLLLNREYSSAIIQRNVDEKPQISFLEPLDIQKQHQLMKQSSSSSSHSTVQQQQQAIVGAGGSSSAINNNNSASSSNSSNNSNNPISCCTSASTIPAPTLSTSIPSVSSAAVAAAAANAALVAAIAASCGNTNNTVNTSASMSTHLDSDLIMASLGAAGASTGATGNSNPSYGTTTVVMSNNSSSSNSSSNGSNCSQMNHQQRAENFDNLSSLDLSAATAVAQAAAAAAVAAASTSVDDRHSPPPSSPTSTTSTSPSSSSSSSPTSTSSSSAAQQSATTIIASGLPVPATTTMSVSQKHSSTHSFPVAEATSATSSTVTKSTSSNSSSSNINNTSSNKNSAQCSIVSPPIPTTVADFLQQQFQQMQNQIRITSPASAGAVVSTSGNNADCNVMSSVTSSAPSLSSLTASLAAAAAAVGTSAAGDLSSNSNSVKLINDFLQHQFQQQQQHSAYAATCPEHPDMKGIDCKTCELIEINMKSPMTPTRSPNSISLFPSNSTMSPTASAAPSFTIGACPEHINGRPLGVDCSRCEMILNSARLNSGVQMSTRNSCKTLKCPQCNWHYKYQETLEIHMREKHPDGESACGYCLAGQQHPRLARGESYTCGYKPYRCEICNYSTTTKGNLSIHMQSDKHLNNMQELNSSQNMANTAAEIRESPKIIMPNMQQQTSKPKPSFRCDVCSYETSVARNLRIHMTSEKHTHNMAVLQNNIKHIQAFSFLQSQNLGQLSAAQSAAVAASNLPNLQNFLPEAALADIAYNQALMIQLLHQNSAAGALTAAAAAAAAANPLTLAPPQQSPKASGVGSGAQPQNVAASQQPAQQTYTSSQSSKLNHPQTPQVLPSTAVASSLSTSSTTSSAHQSSTQQQQQSAAAVLLAEAAAAAAAAAAASADSTTCLQQQQQQQQQQQHQQQQQQDSSLDPPIDPDPKPTTAFSCLICANYNTNTIDELNNHLMIDRSRNTNNNCSDIMMIINNNYICRLCNYKTNLKANFQLHSKTDKHLQKLNYINHIREGGVKNEYKLKYNQTNTVQLKCNCCDFYTNSIQKLNLHTQHMRHDTMKMIFNHLLYLVNSFNASVTNNTSDCSENSEYQLMTKNKVLMCQLCNFSAVNILQMVQHVKSLRHIQVEQFICLQRRSENLESLGLDDVFKIADNSDCVKSERSSPEQQQSVESHQLMLKQDNDKSSPMSLKSCSTMVSGRRDSYTDSPAEHQQNVAASSLLSVAAAAAAVSSNNKELSADVDMPALPSIIYKCNHCDYFAQIKPDMEHHIGSMHLNASEQDFLTIPTNPAALHAFHAAVTAAAVAANAAVASQSRSKSSSPVQMHSNRQHHRHHHEQQQGLSKASVCDSDMLSEVKTERMDTMDEVQSNDECEHFDDPIESTSSRSVPPIVASAPAINNVMCPLCQDTFSEKKTLEMHLMGVHSVNSDGLARLLQLVDNSHWLNSSRRSSTSTTPEPRNSSTPHFEGGQITPQHQQQQQISSAAQQHVSGEEYTCLQCGASFKLQQHLLMHANDAQHYQMANDQYQCLAKHCQQLFSNVLQMLTHYKDTHMNIVISERHVYKYRCKQCSLAFKTQEKLNTHSLYHTMRDATKCMICNRNFRSTQSLQKHMEQAHNQHQVPGSPIPSPNSSGELTNNTGSIASVTPTTVSRCDEDAAASTNAAAITAGTINPFSNNFLQKNYDDQNDDDVGDGQAVVSAANNVSRNSIQSASPLPLLPTPLPPPLPPPDDTNASNTQLDDYLNSQQMSEEYYNDVERKFKCHKCKVAYTNQSYLARHYKSNQHRRNEKLSIYPLEKYLDPNRPFKCEICRESFTQKNILLVHYNSVSHLHKAKKLQSGAASGTVSPAISISSPIMLMSSESMMEGDNPSKSKFQSAMESICGGSGSGSGVSSVTKSLHSNKRKISLELDYESPKKRFKCDICKVAYAQGSTLDIHMRSVLHQTRACRLQEQQKHQQQQQQQAIPMTPPSSSESPTSTTTTTPPTLNDQVYKTLLETYGFDIVKQFNEINKLCPAAGESGNFYCRHCNKIFSSVFVLKTHCEEMHNEKIPLELLERFAENFKSIYLEQQQPPSSPSPSFTSFKNPNLNQCISETNLGATTSTACSESNSPSPMQDSVVSGNESALMMPSTSQPASATSPNPPIVSAVASALLKQQQQQQLSPDIVQKLNLDPTILAQKIMEQNFANFPPNFPGLPQNIPNLQSLQSLQGLQNMQQNLPNMSNLPMNTLDMLNLMQFHHLMSLNFMNLAPPLIFGAAAGPSASVSGNSTSATTELPSTPATQLIQQQTASTSQVSSKQNTSNQKRARTRITDDQLKILRAHFDINNSPSEESIMEMSKKANLPMKVVKHWFRNTLFKERQRNKDSPYNFNNPPSTTLNLEEYERTGQAKVTPLSESGGGGITSFHLQQQQQHQREQQQREQQQQLQQQQLQQQLQSQQLQQQQQQQQQRPPSSQSSDLNFPQLSFHHQQQQQQQQQQHDLSRQQQQDNRPLSHPSSVTSDRGDIHIKSEPNDDIGSSDCDQHMMMHKDHDSEQSMMQSHHQQSMFYNNFETKSESGSSEILSRPQTPNSTSTPYGSNISDILGQQIDNLPLNNMANISNLNNMGPPKKFQMNKMFEKSSNFETNSNSSNSSTSSGKRANRTRFTDYQIKVLQEFFENNSYPKDSDLEYLSKLLLLSPRVIVVWFQNARQKQRKIYENQPNNTFYESEEKKQNINYACKKCNLVFQRYYELIRHQKNHCFKEENNKKSAKAQIAAAQIAQSLSSEDSNSSIDINNANLISSNHLSGQQAAVAAAAVAVAAAVGGSAIPPVPPVVPGLPTSPGIGLLASPQHIFKQQQSAATGDTSTSPLQKFECDKCQLTFTRYDLFKEHQLIHLMNPNLFMNQSYSESSPFGILQNLQGNHNNQQDTSIDLSRQKKRKYSDRQTSPDDQQQQDYEAFNKKFKTDQYDFLYQYFMQNETNTDHKKQFQQQQQQQPDLDLDYLANFYQQNELKKRSNYDFLFQYYLRNESKQASSAANLMLLNDEANKPNMDFLLQYYQLSESKKFFQLDASPQRIHDFPPLLNLSSAAAAINNGVAMQQQQQQVSTTSPSEIAMSTTTNIAATTATTPRTSPVQKQQQKNSSSGGGVSGNNDTTSISSSSSNHNSNITTSPPPPPLPPLPLTATEAKLISATAATATGGGSGVQQTINLPATTVANAITSGNVNSFITNSISNNNRNYPMPKHYPNQQQQQENSSLISNLLDASTVVTASAAAAAAATASDVQSLKLSINNMPTNSTLKSSPVNNYNNINNNSIDADMESGITQHQHDSSISSTGHQIDETITTTEKQNSKRLRTTILPEQLNFLYECYQNESNPSRKMLEEISKKVNLKKRVVQVWYQNSRARERKGQFRQNIQIINKKCPHCAAIFKIKSALEWHLQSKHGDKQAINVDQIPDLKFSEGLVNLSSATPPLTNFGVKLDDVDSHSQQKLNKKDQHSPTTSPPPAVGLISSARAAVIASAFAPSVESPAATAASILSLAKNGGTPLDLSKAPPALLSHHSHKYEQSESEISFSDSNNDHEESNDFFTPSSSLNNGNNGLLLNRASNGTNQRQYDSNTIDTNNSIGYAYNDYNAASNGNLSSDYLGNERDNTNSPGSQTSSNHSAQQKKRFRTQMSNLQVRILKTLFRDVKTPSMTDCSNIGREIGLQKRVIQVWFQNARAKEKKSRNQRFLHDENTFENETAPTNVDSTTLTTATIPEIRDCNICNLKSVNIQEHAFSAQHIGQVRMLLESSTNSRKHDHDDHEQHVDIAMEQEFNGIYSQLYVQQHKNNNTDDERINKSNHEEDDTDVDNNHCSSVITDYDNNLDQNDENGDDRSGHIQSEDLALNEANKAALALRNFNKLQQHFAAATALAKQQQHQQQQQQHQQQQQQEHQQHQPQCDTISSASPPTTMENNLMLKINTDNPLTNHSEMLQQLFNYSQMSVSPSTYQQFGCYVKKKL